MGSKKNKRNSLNIGKPCIYCRRTMLGAHTAAHTAQRDVQVTNEHIIPRGDNGPDEAWNITFACARCNTLRGDLDYALFEDFARVVIRQYPDANTVWLRDALKQYLRTLAVLAFRNPRNARKAGSVALLSLVNNLARH